jgi:hypothetical protein
MSTPTPPRDESNIDRLPSFPAAARDLPEHRPHDDPARGRWVWAGLVLGAGAGVVLAATGSPGWLAVPGGLVALLLTNLFVPGVVTVWLAPVIGWAAAGAFAGWLLDAYAADRADRARRWDR